jgi:hypothetical protein
VLETSELDVLLDELDSSGLENLHHSKYYAPYFITPQAASRSARERILRI